MPDRTIASFFRFVAPFLGIFLGAASAVLGFYLGGMFDGNKQTQATQVQAKTEEIDKEFFTFLDKLAQDQNQKQKYAEVVGKFTQIMAEEAKKNPQAMSSHIEEMYRLVPQAGLGVAIQVEEYASAAVREEMKRLREESAAREEKNRLRQESVVREVHEEMSRLRQESNVVRLNELEKENIQLKEEIKGVREKEKAITKKVPVLLRASTSIWTNLTVFKITNSWTQEVRSYSMPGTPERRGGILKIFLEPAEYSVEFSFKGGSESSDEWFRKNSNFIVSLKPSIDWAGEKFHAIVSAEDI